MVHILARLPEDIGKVIRCSHEQTMTVAATEACEDCGAQAAVVIRGETDSFGFEPIALCSTCLKEVDRNIRAYENGEDVEEAAPAAGHIFVVSECTNYDGKGDWFMWFTSLRKATGYYRACERKAAPWGGLYPDKGVRELTLAAWERMRVSRQRAWEKELADY
jgi:hypothetical protein